MKFRGTGHRWLDNALLLQRVVVALYGAMAFVDGT
ncbi:hypothetical protein LAUMK4_03466 [Mycobacterium persicum]|uniref:DoxX family protein n=1 Tax=Mycobacterium persicum TaxID=1487726 RepID=A0ABY6RKV4_9MYCO|nr:hypothetical protein LAUMK15_03780 [Mycobacterium persicum]VAZ96333.1 hypothetical protein LAUMK4_03466 [Mycobacterium persicum]